MSVIESCAGTTLFGLYFSTKNRNRLSGTTPHICEFTLKNPLELHLQSEEHYSPFTLATLGSIVQNGKFSAATESLLSVLKRLLLPTLGNPTMPILRLFVDLPRITRFGASPSFFFGGILSVGWRISTCFTLVFRGVEVGAMSLVLLLLSRSILAPTSIGLQTLANRISVTL